ncbi:MAG: serine protease [Candidatus Saccharimonadales bacterium]
MQDSSINPYIPQENERAKMATQTLSSPLKRIVKILMIVTGVLVVLIAIGLIVTVPRTSAEDTTARVEFAKVLQAPGQQGKLVPVESTHGFSLKYDNHIFVSYAETTPPVDESGKELTSSYYENDELRTPRDYTVARITPAKSADSERYATTDLPQLFVKRLPSDLLTENADKPDYKGLSQLSLFVKVSTDQRLAAKTADDGTTVTIEATKPSAQTINDVKYQRVRFTTKNDNYRIANVKYDDCYFTIQNDIPYSACITNIRPHSRTDAALDEQVMQSLQFKKPDVVSAHVDKTKNDAATDESGKASDKDSDKDSAKDDKAQTIVTEKESLPFETPTPRYYSDANSLSAIAVNQPSIVRIGSLYCADLSLKVASGEVITTLTDACIGSVSSGTLISNDGYIATTGRAIRFHPKEAINGYINFADSQKDQLSRLDRVLKYLLDSRLILESDADYLRTGAQTGDQEALAKIQNISSVIPDNYITPIKDSYSYAVQPSSKPLVVDASTDSRPAFAYSDAVISAKFVTAKYDIDKATHATFDTQPSKNDIGILKVDGAFQPVAVGKGSGLKSNDSMSMIGFQTFSDSALTITKNQNTPAAVSLTASQLFKSDDKQMIQTSSPIVPGMDGAGVFDQQGALVGFGVYRLLYCPDQYCFANGTVRPSDDLPVLLDEKNIQLNTSSEAAKQWREGVSQYMKANYAVAEGKFATAGSLYGFNEFAAPLSKLAASKKGSAHDTSLMNQLVGIMIGALVLMVGVTVASTAVFIVQKRRLDYLNVGHYGVSQPTVLPQQPYPAPVAPTMQAQPQPGSVYSPELPPQDVVTQPVAPIVSQDPYQAQAQQQPPTTTTPLPPAPQQPPATSPPEDPFYRQ